MPFLHGWTQLSLSTHHKTCQNWKKGTLGSKNARPVPVLGDWQRTHMQSLQQCEATVTVFGLCLRPKTETHSRIRETVVVQQTHGWVTGFSFGLWLKIGTLANLASQRESTVDSRWKAKLTQIDPQFVPKSQNDANQQRLTVNLCWCIFLTLRNVGFPPVWNQVSCKSLEQKMNKKNRELWL